MAVDEAVTATAPVSGTELVWVLGSSGAGQGRVELLCTGRFSGSKAEVALVRSSGWLELFAFENPNGRLHQICAQPLHGRGRKLHALPARKGGLEPESVRGNEDLAVACAAGLERLDEFPT
jgi:hypothetical protein